MPKEPNKPKVLFIASNIPTPKRKSNKVVTDIAHKLSTQYNISILHPTEFAPCPINRMKKYRNLAGNKPWCDGEISITPFKYIRLFGKKLAFFLLPLYKKKVKRYYNQYSTPSLVHSHFALPDGYFAYLLKQLYGIPYFVSFRGSDVKLMTSNNKSNTMKRMLAVLRHANKIIVHNQAQQILLQEHGFSSSLMSHGIEADFLKPKCLNETKDKIVITTIGELIPQKHIDWVINAVIQYDGRKTLSLMIAGEGPQKEELVRLAWGYPNIRLLGKIKHEAVNELLCDSDIFALPSFNETFGLVYLEATAHQNAVIATKDTGIWGHFKENEEMLYCDSYDSFQKELYELIDNDTFRNQLAQKAFDKTSAYFTWDQVIEKYTEMYNDCLRNHLS